MRARTPEGHLRSLHTGETVRNLIPTHAEAEHIAEYLAEPLEVRRVDYAVRTM